MNATTKFSENRKVKVQSLLLQGLEMTEKDQASFQHTKKEPPPALSYNIRKPLAKTNVRFATLVVPCEKNTRDIKIRIMKNSKWTISTFNLKLMKMA